MRRSGFPWFFKMHSYVTVCAYNEQQYPTFSFYLLRREAKVDNKLPTSESQAKYHAFATGRWDPELCFVIFAPEK